MSAEKSPAKSPRKLSGVAADKSLRGPGRGPKKGAPNAGRPPSEIKRLFLEGAAKALPELQRIAREGIEETDRVRAIDILGKYGGLASIDIEITRPTTLVIAGLDE